MATDTAACVRELTERVQSALKLGEVSATAARVKSDLEEMIGAGRLRLPDSFRRTRPDCYARRLLHRDPTGFTAVVMTWGPEQRTPIHDHAGIWCVEGVVEGVMEVTRYELVEASGEAFRFEERGSVEAGVGAAGCLIPPFEYHVLGNAQRDAPAITLHVYGAEMDHCHIFQPRGDGWYERQARTLSYHE